jgi:hypothetical protein
LARRHFAPELLGWFGYEVIVNMSTGESERYSQLAADAVAMALRLARSDMPNASADRLLLLIVGQAAACLGRLGANSQDVLTINWGYYEQGRSERLAIWTDEATFPLDDPAQVT